MSTSVVEAPVEWWMSTDDVDEPSDADLAAIDAEMPALLAEFDEFLTEFTAARVRAAKNATVDELVDLATSSLHLWGEWLS